MLALHAFACSRGTKLLSFYLWSRPARICSSPFNTVEIHSAQPETRLKTSLDHILRLGRLRSTLVSKWRIILTISSHSILASVMTERTLHPGNSTACAINFNGRRGQITHVLPHVRKPGRSFELLWSWSSTADSEQMQRMCFHGRVSANSYR